MSTHLRVLHESVPMNTTMIESRWVLKIKKMLWTKSSLRIGKVNSFISLQLLHKWAHSSSRKLHGPTPARRLCKTGWPDTEDRACRSASYRHVDGGDQLSLGGRGTLPLRQIRSRIYVSILIHLCLIIPLI